MISGESQIVVLEAPPLVVILFVSHFLPAMIAARLVFGGGQLPGTTIDLGGNPSTSSHQKNVSPGRIELQSISLGVFRCFNPIHSNMRWISSLNGSKPRPSYSTTVTSTPGRM